MSPRIAYWTSAFEPEMEAIAGEVALLRRHFPSSVAWGLSHRHWLRLSWKRGYCLNPRLHLLFRAATRILEPAFQVNHIFGSLGDWFYLQGRRQRPTVLTLAALNPPVDKSLLERVDRFVVEHPGGTEYLRKIGFNGQRVRLIFPAVDLDRFSPKPPTQGPFTVLFASSPDEESWLEARGVPQILDAAARRPQMQFCLLWRPWGNALGRVRKWIVERDLRNVELLVECAKDMARHYNEAHVTVALFTEPSRSKPAPNSVIESLACGRPVVVTPAVGLADMIEEARAGIVCEPTGEALAESLDKLQADWPRYSASARTMAQRWFGVEEFLKAHGRLYDEMTANTFSRDSQSRA